MMTFSTQNGDIFQSATFPDRVSMEDKRGKCHTLETGSASGGSTSFFDVAGKYRELTDAFFTPQPTVFEQNAKNPTADHPVDLLIQDILISANDEKYL